MAVGGGRAVLYFSIRLPTWAFEPGAVYRADADGSADEMFFPTWTFESGAVHRVAAEDSVDEMFYPPDVPHHFGLLSPWLQQGPVIGGDYFKTLTETAKCRRSAS